jgi:hypothetical protein
MFLFKKLVTLCTLSLLTVNAFAQNDFCSARNTSFQEGEQLKFKVYYNVGFIWVYAGDAVFNITRQEVNGHKTYHIIGDGKTAKSYEWAYKVKDRYESYIDEQTMMPVKFVRNVNEGGVKIFNNVEFNHSKGKAISNGDTYSIPKCTQDVLSSIYYARNIDYNKLKPGDKIPFSMFLDDKVYSLYIRYLGKEKITTRYGTFNTVKIAPLLIEGTIFKGGEKMIVWVSDDNNHIPVRVSSPILIGSVKVDLVDFSNLRNPLSAMASKKHGDD